MKQRVWQKVFDANVSGSFAAAMGLLVLRLGSGGLMLFAHGWGKLAGFSERAANFRDPLVLGPELSLALTVFSEVVCAGLVMLGLATRLASIPLVITMAVIVFIIHGADPFRQQELPLLFGLAFLTLLFTGPGKLSLDALISKRL
jgi:putative oxidoreductase